MLNGPNPATVPGRDPDISRNIPTAPLLAPERKVREKPSAAASPRKRGLFHIYTYTFDLSIYTRPKFSIYLSRDLRLTFFFSVWHAS